MECGRSPMASLVLLSVRARGTRDCRGHYSFSIEHEMLIVGDGLGAALMLKPNLARTPFLTKYIQ
jgi:hypothetical protein